MALFQYKNILLPYQIRSAPFAHDLFLLQGSRFDSNYWLPVLVGWVAESSEGGRVVTCDWQREGRSDVDLAEYFHRFFQTMGLQSLHAVGCDDAAKIIEDLHAGFPGAMDKTLLFPHHPPKGDELQKAVAGFVASSK